MIVDLDTRLWTSSEDLGDELAAAIRRAGASRWIQPDAGADAMLFASKVVDASVVVGFESTLLRAAVAERSLLDMAGRAMGRIFVARALDPLSPGAAARVESARRDGFCAIWMDPALQGFNPSDTRAMRVFDRAEACQLPVLLGWSGPQVPSARLEFARPYLLDEVARAFPRLSIVIAGFGAPFVGETLTLLAKHDRVFTTVAGIAARPWELLGALQGARDHGVEQKVLFASGFPFDLPSRAIEAVYSVNSMVATTPLPHLPRAMLREIVERDSVSLLGLGTAPEQLERTANRALASDSTLRLAGEDA